MSKVDKPSRAVMVYNLIVATGREEIFKMNADAVVDHAYKIVDGILKRGEEDEGN